MKKTKYPDIIGLDSSEALLKKLFYFSSMDDFISDMIKVNKGSIDVISSRSFIKPNGEVYFICFEHFKSIFDTMQSKLILYSKNGDQTKILLRDSKPSYIFIDKAGKPKGEIRLHTFFRKCLGIMFETAYKAFRPLISLDLFCEWTEEYIFSTDKNKASDLATHLYQKISYQAVEAFIYCLENKY